MSRALVIIASQADRTRLKAWIDKAPWGTRCELRAPKRSLDQNSRFWAMLTEIARQVPWHGVRLSAEDYKLLFLAALRQEMRVVPNLDGTAFVQLGRSSSDLTKAEMSDIMTLMEAFAAQHGAVLADNIACDTPLPPIPCDKAKRDRTGS